MSGDVPGVIKLVYMHPATRNWVSTKTPTASGKVDLIPFADYKRRRYKDVFKRPATRREVGQKLTHVSPLARQPAAELETGSHETATPASLIKLDRSECISSSV